MKKFGLFLVVCLCLGIFSAQPVSAQTVNYGFVSLLPEGYDTAIPREVTSSENFDRILPFLLDAKSMGLIEEFEPDFFGGFVKITNPADTLSAVNSSFPLYRTREEAVVKPRISSLSIGKLADDIFIKIPIHSVYVEIDTHIPNAHIIGTLKSPLGEVLGVLDRHADSSGFLFDAWDSYEHMSYPGYRVSFKVYDATDVWVGTYSTTIPRIVFKSVEKSTGIITGTAPAGKEYWAEMSHQNFTAAGGYYRESLSGTVPASGSWLVDFTKAFRGGDLLTFGVVHDSNFAFYKGNRAARVGCRLGRDYCYLNTLPFKPVVLTVIHDSTTYKISGNTSASGYLYYYLADDKGDPVFITPGDKVSGTDAKTEIVPKLTIKVDRLANTASGIAPALKWLTVDVYVWAASSADSDWVKSDSTGVFLGSFVLDIPATGPVEPNVIFINPASGNYWAYARIIP